MPLGRTSADDQDSVHLRMKYAVVGIDAGTAHREGPLRLGIFTSYAAHRRELHFLQPRGGDAVRLEQVILGTLVLSLDGRSVDNRHGVGHELVAVVDDHQRRRDAEPITAGKAGNGYERRARKLSDSYNYQPTKLDAGVASRSIVVCLRPSGGCYARGSGG